jgi:cell division protein FtsL
MQNKIKRLSGKKVFLYFFIFFFIIFMMNGYLVYESISTSQENVKDLEK